ncbi:MAG: hypothetical protein IT332_11940 [Ardenticatenales bacterium]|nr:hypothetical protein [Ardenticatenales bacterium]
MTSPLRSVRTLVAALTLAIAATILAAPHAAFAAAPAGAAQPTTLADHAVLANMNGGSHASYTPVLQACKTYTVRLNYDMRPYGMPVEEAIGFQVWNNNGDALLTDSPYGERLWEGGSQHYYLQSVRRVDNAWIEEVTFHVPCGETNPNYSIQVFNYAPESTLHFTLSLPTDMQ